MKTVTSAFAAEHGRNDSAGTPDARSAPVIGPVARPQAVEAAATRAADTARAAADEARAEAERAKRHDVG